MWRLQRKDTMQLRLHTKILVGSKVYCKIKKFDRIKISLNRDPVHRNLNGLKNKMKKMFLNTVLSLHDL